MNNDISVTDIEIAFGTTRLLPDYDKVPDEFKRHGGTKFNKFVSDCFFCGVSSVNPKPKKGVNIKEALRCMKAHLASWEPKHEHKEAGVAYMLSQWFDDIDWEQAK